MLPIINYTFLMNLAIKHISLHKSMYFKVFNYRTDDMRDIQIRHIRQADG